MPVPFPITFFQQSAPPGYGIWIADDTTTQGNWVGNYGSDGWRMAQYLCPDNDTNHEDWEDSSNLPGYVSGMSTDLLIQAGAGINVLDSSSSTDARKLTRFSPFANSLAGSWNTWSGNPSTFYWEMTVTGTKQVAIYLLSYDEPTYRDIGVTVLDSEDNVLAAERRYSATTYYDGVWALYEVSGYVKFLFTHYGEGFTNASVSAFMFDPEDTGTPAIGTTAEYVSTDDTTQGNWVGNYGADGYCLAQYDAPDNTFGGGDISNWESYADLPAYVTEFTLTAAQVYVWDTTSVGSDARYLTRPNSGGGTNDIAAVWYLSTTLEITIDVGTTVCDIAIYMMSQDSNSRNQTITIYNADTNAALTSGENFSGSALGQGEWAIYTISGKVRIEVENFAGGLNAIVNAIMFDS
jgi:hypothetical protein